MVSTVSFLDYFSLSDPQFAVRGGVLIEEVPLSFELGVNVACSKRDCNVAAAGDNVHFVLSSSGRPDGSDLRPVVTISGDWAERGGDISPSWGVGFTQAGQIRWVSLVLQPETCRGINAKRGISRDYANYTKALRPVNM